MNSLRFDAIGTRWQIDLYSPLSEKKRDYLQILIKDRVEQFERNYSRFRFDSFTNVTLNQVGTFTLPPDAEPLFTLYERLYRLTDGAFTPFIGQVLIDAGYDAEYSLEAGEIHKPPSWDSVMDYHFPNIQIKKPEVLDFGAGGKGYLIDIVSALIKDFGIQEFCVDAGGDIRYECSKPLRIGLENPNDLTQAIGVVTISSTSLCASAGSRRKWGKFHHIIDPRSLSSPDKVIATWVTAPSTIVADALATCLFLVHPSVLLPHFPFEYLVLFHDNSFEKSKGFPAELFLK